MSTTTSIEELQGQIEKLVRAHVAAVEAAATAAVARAVSSGMARTQAGGTPSSARRPSRKQRPDRRRSPEEVAELAERLAAAVHATPGETMTVLAAEVGAKPRDLGIAVKHLRSAARIRTVGERQGMRYFPAAPATPAASETIQ